MATLAQLAQQYLNQGLPNISGIFSLPQASSVTTPVVEEEQVTTPQGLTIEQLRLMYPEMFIQQNQGGGDGRDDIDDVNRIDNNAGIYSFKDLKNYALGLPPAAKIGSIIGGPFGFAAGLIGTSIADKFGFTQAGRDRKAREDAAARGAEKQAMIDKRNFDTNFKGYFSGQKGGGGGGGSTQEQAGPGFSGSGSAAEMGSF
tara:strand:- start:419 stop:1021 length:603 start_codon:yes stop_codon:yes gene_type:complete